MIARLLTVAVIGGLVAGLFVSLAQMYKVTPLIHKAETYESTGAPGAGTTGDGHSHGHDQDQETGDSATTGQPHDHDHGGAWAPADGVERITFTVLTNVLTSIGFGLLLVAGFALSGREINAQNGLLWGLGGFAAFALAPAAILPPEMPGAAAADLTTRQILWVSVAAVTAAGLALAAFAKSMPLRAVGIALVVVPLLFSPPHGEGAGLVPPELAAEFVAASLAVAALFWAFLGSLSGALYRRFMG